MNNTEQVRLDDVPVYALGVVEGNILGALLWQISSDLAREDYNKSTGECLKENGCFVKLYDAYVISDFRIHPYSDAEVKGCTVDSELFSKYLSENICPIDSKQTMVKPNCKNTISFFSKDLIPVMIATGDTYRVPVSLQGPLDSGLSIRMIVQCCVNQAGGKYVKPIRVDLNSLRYMKIWD